MGKVKLEDDDGPFLDSLYIGGSRIQVCFMNLSTQGWDFGILGSSPILLSSTLERPHLDFIRWPNARVKDRVTGRDIFKLSGRYAEPTQVQWDGQYLVAGYKTGEVLILDFNYMLPQ